MREKRLYLSKNKVISGVAGGVAEYLGVDPTVVRLIWAFTAFAGAGVIVYLVAMFIIPERPSDKPHIPDSDEQEAIDDLKQAARQLADTSGEVAQDVADRVKRSVDQLVQKKESDKSATTDKPSPSADGEESNRSLGIILLIIGAFFLFRNIIPQFPWAMFWPVALIAVGVVFLAKGVGGRG